MKKFWLIILVAVVLPCGWLLLTFANNNTYSSSFDNEAVSFNNLTKAEKDYINQIVSLNNQAAQYVNAINSLASNPDYTNSEWRLQLAVTTKSFEDITNKVSDIKSPKRFVGVHAAYTNAMQQFYLAATSYCKWSENPDSSLLKRANQYKSQAKAALFVALEQLDKIGT